MKKTIRLITTGGTIVSKGTEIEGAQPTLSGEDLVESIPGLDTLAHIQVTNFTQVPSTEMTIELMFALAKEVQNALADDEIDGVVITHGTDTLEETAYLHHLLVKAHKPVVFTGAMRTASSISADGPKNLYNAVVVAANSQSKHYPPLVVANDEVHLAKYVTKFHATAPHSFQSLNGGPIGIVSENRVHYLTMMNQKETISVNDITANVELIKVAAGASDFLLQKVIEAQYDGIVIEGTGSGHVPPTWVPTIERAIQSGIAVIVVPRSPAGFPLLNTYGINGGEIDLRKKGVIFGYMNGQKARIFLILALSAKWDGEKMIDFMNE